MAAVSRPPTQEPRRLLFGVSAPGTVFGCLAGQLGYLHTAGFVTSLIAPDTPSGEVAALSEREGAGYFPMPVSRNPSVLRDLNTFVRVLRVVCQVRPHIVIAGTPKMSLLLLFSSFLLRVPERVYLCHGLRYEGAHGVRQRFLIHVERLLMRLSTRTVAVSPSVRDRLREIGGPPNRPLILGAGSANGVALERFTASAERVAQARVELGLVGDQVAIAFVGRLTHDKGLRALVACAKHLPDVIFLIAGHSEPTGSQDHSDIVALEELQNVRLLGRVSRIESVYWAASLLVLPTLREGMPTVVLEAAAAARPTVAFEATGTVDAVVHGVTGLLVPAGDDKALVEETARLLSEPDRCNTLGKDAETRVRRLFDNRDVWASWERFFHEIS